MRFDGRSWVCRVVVSGDRDPLPPPLLFLGNGLGLLVGFGGLGGDPGRCARLTLRKVAGGRRWNAAEPFVDLRDDLMGCLFEGGDDLADPLGE